MNLTSIYKRYFPYLILFFHCTSVFSLMEIYLIFCLCYYLLCRRVNNHFDVLFRRIGPILFPSKDGEDVVPEGKNGRKGVSFPPESASSPL